MDAIVAEAVQSVREATGCSQAERKSICDAAANKMYNFLVQNCRIELQRQQRRRMLLTSSKWLKNSARQNRNRGMADAVESSADGMALAQSEDDCDDLDAESSDDSHLSDEDWVANGPRLRGADCNVRNGLHRPARRGRPRVANSNVRKGPHRSARQEGASGRVNIPRAEAAQASVGHNRERRIKGAAAHMRKRSAMRMNVQRSESVANEWQSGRRKDTQGDPQNGGDTEMRGRLPGKEASGERDCVTPDVIEDGNIESMIIQSSDKDEDDTMWYELVRFIAYEAIACSTARSSTLTKGLLEKELRLVAQTALHERTVNSVDFVAGHVYRHVSRERLQKDEHDPIYTNHPIAMNCTQNPCPVISCGVSANGVAVQGVRILPPVQFEVARSKWLARSWLRVELQETGLHEAAQNESAGAGGAIPVVLRNLAPRDSGAHRAAVFQVMAHGVSVVERAVRDHMRFVLTQPYAMLSKGANCPTRTQRASIDSGATDRYAWERTGEYLVDCVLKNQNFMAWAVLTLREICGCEDQEILSAPGSGHTVQNGIELSGGLFDVMDSLEWPEEATMS